MYRLIALFALCACARNMPVSVPRPPSSLNRAIGIPVPQYDGLASAVDDWKAVVVDTLAIVHDPIFRDKLIGMTRLNARHATPTTGLEVVAAYLGATDKVGQVVTQYVRTNDKCDGNQTASTSIEKTGDKRFARTTLNPCTLDRGKLGKSVAEHACAINTAAHEMAHAVLDDKLFGIYQDNGHKHEVTPLVSYTVGAVAQCIYLMKSDLLTDSMFNNCVNYVGTTSFDGTSCDADWPRSLRGSCPFARDPVSIGRASTDRCRRAVPEAEHLR